MKKAEIKILYASPYSPSLSPGTATADTESYTKKLYNVAS